VIIGVSPVAKALTAELIYQRALHYLERYAAPRAGVKAVLQRSVMRAQRRGDSIPQAVPEWIEAALDKLERAGYLSDKSFAETKLVSLRRAGTSSQKIRQKLAVKGVTVDVVADVLEHDESDDRQAAVAFARRRRLGPYADEKKRAALKDKHIAALARAGFSLTIARWVVNAVDAEALVNDLSE
jgi:regulatory protein